MSGYTKLFSSIITSSIWSEDDKTRLMWITMLATSDAKGYVNGSIPGMAAIARMNLEDAQQSIDALCAPDPYSRTKDEDGRRLLPVDGGWQIVNYRAYREQRDPEVRARQNREAQQRWRDKHRKPDVSQHKPDISRGKSKKAQAEAEAIPPLPPKGGTGVSDFDRFWEVWPKKRDKVEARKVFAKLNPDAKLLEAIIAAVAAWTPSEEWTKQGGRYIPGPAKWLRSRRWEDELPAESQADATAPLDVGVDGLTPRQRALAQTEGR